MSSVPSDLCVKPCCSLQGEGSAPKAGRGTLSYSYVRSNAGETMAGGDLLVCGPKNVVVAALTPDSTVATWLVSSGVLGDAALLPQLYALAMSLSPGKDVNTAAVAETHGIRADGGLFRVAICALPTQSSRHNSPAHPHAITDFVRQKCGAGTGPLHIVLPVADPAHGFAAGTAAARVFPQFSTKKAFGGAPAMGGKDNEVQDYSGDVQSHEGVVAGHQVTQACAAGGVERPVLVHLVDGETEPQPADAETIGALASVGDGVMLAARLVDAPTNYMHTDAVEAEATAVYDAVAKNIADGAELKMTVIKGDELRKQGFGLLWGVGKAAVHKPALLVLSHLPAGSTEGGIAMCGKGIVYDTGGLSIKMKTFMPGMKRDMGGAAAVLAAWQAVVERGGLAGGRPLHCVMCMAENSVGPESTRPDDIHTGFSGKTVEIVNTDAEGRLVLGDGVAYAASVLKVDTVVDVATLTGAQGVAVGKRHAAVYCSTEDSEMLTLRAGRFCGDLTHALPYAPEMWRHEFRSAVADMTNNVKDRGNAQSACAAQFIGNHLPDGWLDAEPNKWIHVDMAAPAYDKSSERATGYGVALLAALCGVNKSHFPESL